MKRVLVTLTAAALCLTMAFGCSFKMGSATSDMNAVATAPGAAEYAPGYDSAMDMDYPSSGAGLGGLTLEQAASAEERYGGRKMILTYEMTLETDAFDDLLSALEARLAAAGGYVQRSSISGKRPEAYGDRGRYGSLTLRIPVDRVEAFYADAKALGTVLNEYAYGDDITAEYFDRETRLSVLQIQLERLTSILTEAATLADVLALETEIARVNMEIESLTGELRRYDALVDYATVELSIQETTLREGPAATRSIGQRIKEGFTGSLNGIGVFFVELFVWVVSALPVLVILAIVGVILFFIIRGAHRRRKARKANKAKEKTENIQEEKQQ